MLRIIKHIEHLLSAHDCVIVPDFGGFVLQVVPTRYKAERHLFEPMQKEIVFNETLQHNDGLLIESYMQAEGKDYRASRLLMQDDVAILKETLRLEGKLEMGAIGSFTLGEEKQLIFQAGTAEWLNAAMYGLPSFSFDPLCVSHPEAEEDPEEKKKEVYYIPISRRLVRVMVASVVAIALFLSVSTPVKEVNRSAYTASFIPTEMMTVPSWSEKKMVSEEVPLVAKEKTIEIPAQSKSEAVHADVPKVEAKKAVSPESKPEPAVAKVVSQKMYHVVIASFPTKKQAEQYMQEVDRSLCPNFDLVQNKGKYRVYADRFTDRKSAENYMMELRKNKQYKDAWLFISR